MERKRRKFTASSLSLATHLSRQRIESALKIEDQFINDPERETRLQACLCKPCFYGSPRIAGAAITHEPCMCCGNMEMYGSTDTDALCLSCAQEAQLCKHCGGDVESRKGRKNWPQAKI